jgi:hypothetical protein
MHARAAGYALTCLITLILKLVSCSIIGLTVAKFKPLVLPIHGFSLSHVHLDLHGLGLFLPVSCKT